MPRVDLKTVAKAICDMYGYHLVEQVGAGAFKETFHTRVLNGDSRALKVFQQVNSPERTEREIDAMVRCDHPNIGKLFSVDGYQMGGEDYLFSLEEYLPGWNLTQRVAGGSLSPKEAQVLGEALISAVGHIASHGLVHRDLKPDNIMFRADGVTPMIVDFGLVRDLSSTSLTRTWVAMGPGTPYYAAPEQLTNNKELIDWRTDQFALGVLLAECIVGYHPYSEAGDDSAQVVERVAQRDGPTERFKAAVTSCGLPTLVRMTAPWPVERIRTPVDLAQDWQKQEATA